MNSDSELHERIRSKKMLYGCGVESLNPATTELAGMVGFDLVWGDLEHGAGSPNQVETFCIAAKAGGALPIIRISFTDRTHIMRALEAGARLVAVPMVETPEMAREIVEYGKYKPVGNRGFAGSTRGVRYGFTDPATSMAWNPLWPPIKPPLRPRPTHWPARSGLYVTSGAISPRAKRPPCGN